MAADTGQARGNTTDRRLILATAAIAAFYGLGFLGLALLPLLARDHPRLLILLNPTTAVLLLVSARVDLASFIALATLRRIALHILCFLFGAWYGRAAVQWVQGYGGRATRLVGLIEHTFARVRWAVLLLAPGPLPGVLAGQGQMGRVRFLALDLTGTLLALLLIRFAADLASDPLGSALRLIDRHAIPLTALCAAATALWLGVRWWGRTRAEGVGD